MADNIAVTSGAMGTEVIAAKEVSGVKYPVHVIYDSNGNPLDYSGPNLVGGPLSTGRSAKTAGTNVYAEMGKFGEQLAALIDDFSGQNIRSFVANSTYTTYAGTNTVGLFSQDALIGVASYPQKYDAIKNGFRKDALPSRCFRINTLAASDNAALILASAGIIGKRLTGYCVRSGTPLFVKFYDKATAPASTDTPAIVYAIAPGAHFNIPLDDYVFQNGLGVRVVTGAVDADATAPAAGDIVGLSLTYST